MDIQNRLKSPVFWSALGAQIVSLLVLLGVLDVTESEVVNGFVVAILELLTAFGIFNNPTNRSGL